MSHDTANRVIGAGSCPASIAGTVETELANKPAVIANTGSGAIAVTTAIGAPFKLLHFTLALSAAPTTSEDFTLTLDANAGAGYDVPLFALDLSASSVVDLVAKANNPDNEIVEEYVSGDEIAFAWPNSNSRTWNLQIYYRLL
jgi:hypothetical protein